FRKPLGRGGRVEKIRGFPYTAIDGGCVSDVGIARIDRDSVDGPCDRVWPDGRDIDDGLPINRRGRPLKHPAKCRLARQRKGERRHYPGLQRLQTQPPKCPFPQPTQFPCEPATTKHIPHGVLLYGRTPSLPARSL